MNEHPSMIEVYNDIEIAHLRQIEGKEVTVYGRNFEISGSLKVLPEVSLVTVSDASIRFTVDDIYSIVTLPDGHVTINLR